MRTRGVSPKVPAQALVTVLVWLAAYFGIELPADVAGALAVLIGAGAGVAAPPGTVVR
jgi:hypothetical protein